MSPRTCYYFGCWGYPGHRLFAAGGRTVVVPDLEGVRLDGSLAPRMMDGKIYYDGQIALPGARWRFIERSRECRPGQFLRHRVGEYTALAWWDSYQGDSRPGSNSVLLLRWPPATAEEVIAAGRLYFPQVLKNLSAHGIQLTQMEIG